MALQSVTCCSWDKLMRSGWQRRCNVGPMQYLCVCVCVCETDQQLTDVYCDVTGVQRVRKWCKEFEVAQRTSMVIVAPVSRPSREGRTWSEQSGGVNDFGTPTTHLRGRRICNNEEVEFAVREWLRMKKLDGNFISSC